MNWKNIMDDEMGKKLNLKRLRNFPFLKIPRDIISLEDENGNVFSLKKKRQGGYALVDEYCNEQKINYIKILDLFVKEAKNKKVIVMSNKDDLKEIISSSTEKVLKKVLKKDLVLLSNNTRKEKIINDFYRNANRLKKFPFLYYHETFTNEYIRTKDFDDDIAWIHHVLKQRGFPKTIKKFFCNKRNCNKVAIYLYDRHHNELEYANDIGKYFNYNRNLELIFDDNIESMEQKLFYAKLKNVIDFSGEILYFLIDENLNIKGEKLFNE